MHFRNGHNGHRNGHVRIAGAERSVAEHHVGASAKDVAEHASTITRLELELAAMELKRKAMELAAGSAIAVTAAVLGVFALGFACAAAAAGLATAMPWWAALLIVTGGLAVFAAILGLVAKGRFERATPPLPDRAIRQAKLTKQAIGH